MLGVPAYGRTFTLANPSKNGLGDDIDGPGEPGPLTLSSGFLGFHEVNNLFMKVLQNLKKKMFFC